MNEETPLTDAFYDGPCKRYESRRSRDFARQLERRLAAAESSGTTIRNPEGYKPPRPNASDLSLTLDWVGDTNLFRDQPDPVDVLAAEVVALRVELAAARAALEPFARIAPSSFFSEDGSDGEGYAAILSNGSPHSTEFTGADLAAARKALSDTE